MKKPVKVWSANREKRYGIVADSFQSLKVKAASKLGVTYCEDIKLVLEEDGTVIDESYWKILNDHTKLILLQPTETWRPDSFWPPDKKDKFDFVDGSNGEQITPEKLFLKLQQNPSVMVMLNLNEMEIIKDTNVDQIDGKNLNKKLAKGFQQKCIELYLTKKKEEEALEVIDLIKQRITNKV